MIPSLLTAMCFAMAGISARQSAQCSGPERANTGRLLVGMLILGLLAWISWQGMPSRLLAGLAIAGGIGFGFGGFFMMLTLKRLGTPTSLLLVESTTAILAGLVITSYSIHYTKLYEWLHGSLFRGAGDGNRGRLHLLLRGQT